MKIELVIEIKYIMGLWLAIVIRVLVSNIQSWASDGNQIKPLIEMFDCDTYFLPPLAWFCCPGNTGAGMTPDSSR